MIDQTRRKRKKPAEKGSSQAGPEVSPDNLAVSSRFALPDVYSAIAAHPGGLQAAMTMIRRNELMTRFSALALGPPKRVVSSREAIRQPLPRPPPSRAQASSAIIAWMEDRRKRLGDELKKVLRAAALEQFPDLQERDFNAAYKAVYERKRGRPHKPTP